ncbi:serpin family protein [Gracilimonas sp. BCB1]|uniref:serpin family protein n=1 Tax=Gracilimonas sp. BCB1 TaxID=3152362 RepID=UPI0032D8CA20
MRTNRLLSLLFFALFLIPLSCTTDVTGPNSSGELPRELSAAEKKLVEDGQSFGFNVFKSTVAGDSSKNIFISPLSISVALGMTMNGAEGETFEQMRETLALQGLSQDEINQGYQSLIKLLTEADPKVKMQIANSVWSREGFAVQESFTNTLEEYFDATTRELNFSDPKSTDIINQWVADNTNGLIEKIIDGQIPPEMIMYLINAIYFQGDWTYQFDKEETREHSFSLEEGGEIMVDMMRQERLFNINMNEEVHMIDLAYGDSLFSMTVMMPADTEKPIDEFISDDLTKEKFDSWIAGLSKKDMPILFPKFELSYKIKMNDILKSMGMEVPFEEGKADFSGINPDARLFISQVNHKTYVKVDEKGTEAAAVTSVGIGVTSVPQTFSVDRPFVFMIREQNSGAILFMGKVKNPKL